jgi:hypothetical protein
LLLRLSGVFLLRLAERNLFGLLFQEPPRITRWAPSGPLPDGKRSRKTDAGQAFTHAMMPVSMYIVFILDAEQ